MSISRCRYSQAVGFRCAWSLTPGRGESRSPGSDTWSLAVSGRRRSLRRTSPRRASLAPSRNLPSSVSNALATVNRFCAPLEVVRFGFERQNPARRGAQNNDRRAVLGRVPDRGPQTSAAQHDVVGRLAPELLPEQLGRRDYKRMKMTHRLTLGHDRALSGAQQNAHASRSPRRRGRAK